MVERFRTNGRAVMVDIQLERIHDGKDGEGKEVTQRPTLNTYQFNGNKVNAEWCEEGETCRYLIA